MQRIKELDGLRAIAILLVVGCHYAGFARLLGGLPGFGWVGVDIFFVLSGYLITTILLSLRNQDHPYKTFYARRLIRIFPPYIAATAVVVVLGIVSNQYWVIAPKFLFKQVFVLQAYTGDQGRLLIDMMLHPVRYLTHFPNLLSYAHNLPKMSAAGLAPSLAAPAVTYWSLSVEEYFYLFWAPVALRCSHRSIIAIGIFICLVEIFLRCYCADWQGYLQLIFRLDAPLYGAFLALLLAHWRSTLRPVAIARLFVGAFLLSVAGIVLILLALGPVIGREIRQSPLFLAFGLPLISCATATALGLVILRADSNWWFARLLRTRTMQLLGTMSYTMYLVHLLAALFIVRLLAPMGHYIAHGFLLIEAVLSLIVTIAIAYLSWHYIEKPLLRWKDRLFPGTKVTEPVLN